MHTFCYPTYTIQRHFVSSSSFIFFTKALAVTSIYDEKDFTIIPLYVMNTPVVFLQESIKILRSTIEAKSEVYGDLSAEVADTWKLIGSIHMSQGDTEKGLRGLKKVK